MDVASADCPTTLMLATMERLKTSEAQTKHIETSLCDKCAVIRIDDKSWGLGVEKRDDGRGAPFVLFPESTGPTGPVERIELAYEREDTYPDLPTLQQGSTNGCEFCKLLQESLILHCHATYKSKGQGVARIRTRKISYSWRHIDLPVGGLHPPEYRRGILELDYDWIRDTTRPDCQRLYFEFFSDQGW